MKREWTWIAPGALPYPNDDREVSSVRLSFSPSHAHLSVWNRGALAGQLTIDRRDWRAFVCMFGFRVDEIDEQQEKMMMDGGS